MPRFYCPSPLQTGAVLDLPPAPARLLLSLHADAKALRHWAALASTQAALVLSGPEGGLSAVEEDMALAQGFAPVTLGPRVLRAETAALAALVVGLGLRE